MPSKAVVSVIAPALRALLGTVLACACTMGCRVAASAPQPQPAPPAARAPTPAPTAPATLGCMDARGNDVIRRANSERGRGGLPVLLPDGRLMEAAQRHAADMARGDFMAHEGSDGSVVGARATRARYRWTVIAENVAAGYPDPTAVVAGWMTSPGHRANILGVDVEHVGVGYAYRTDTSLHSYWVMVFGASDEVVPVRAC